MSTAEDTFMSQAREHVRALDRLAYAMDRVMREQDGYDGPTIDAVWFVNAFHYVNGDK